MTLPASSLANEGEACAEQAFVDRDAISAAHVGAVDCAVELGVARGFDDETFRPLLEVPRDQMASLIAQALMAADVDLAEADDQGFEDLAGNPHAESINRLAAAGIVQGRSDAAYEPKQHMRRDQLASVLLQALAYATDVDVAWLAGGGSPFVDIGDSVHAASIEGAYNHELVRGHTAERYEPAVSTPRQQMATLLLNLLAAIDDPRPPEAPGGFVHGDVVAFEDGHVDVEGTYSADLTDEGEQGVFRLFYDTDDEFVICDVDDDTASTACGDFDADTFASQLAVGDELDAGPYQRASPSYFRLADGDLDVAQRLSIDIAPDPAGVDEDATATATVFDTADGSADAGRTVRFVAHGDEAGVTPEQATADTDNDGHATFTLSTDTAQVVTVLVCITDDADLEVCASEDVTFE